MKHFLKVFFASLVSFILVIGIGIYVYSEIFHINTDGRPTADLFGSIRQAMAGGNAGSKASGRINILLLGLEHERTDTIMFASFDAKTKSLEVISIPRDTYIERDGFVNSGNNKINTVYTVKGIDGLKEVIGGMLETEIDNYVAIDYDGVRAAVDAIGGVEVDVPFHMKYSDPYSDPPLKIDIPAGLQTIGGDRAMEFLRFRKSNYAGYSGYAEGDIGRIKAQQDFVKLAVKKSLSIKLPKVMADVYPYIETDISLGDATKMAVGAIGMTTDSMNFQMLPGESHTSGGLSFYFADLEEAKRLVRVMYGLEKDLTETVSSDSLKQ